MPRIQVVYASRHGGTEGIAQCIAEALTECGTDAVVVDAATDPDSTGFDGYVIGSGVYMGAWLKDGLEYLERNRSTLADKPVWLFSSGPLPNEHMGPRSTDPIENALGPLDGPGFNPDAAPTNLLERVVRAVPPIKKVLPAGDFRPWPQIDAWARRIAIDVTAATMKTA